MYGLFSHCSNFGESTSFSLVWALKSHSFSGQRYKIELKGKVCSRASEETLLILLATLFCTRFLLKTWRHQGDIHFRAEMDLRVIPILQMKKPRTRAVSRTVFTQQDLNPNYLLVSGVDEGPWREEQVLWATPESGCDVMP